MFTRVSVAAFSAESYHFFVRFRQITGVSESVSKRMLRHTMSATIVCLIFSGNIATLLARGIIISSRNNKLLDI